MWHKYGIDYSKKTIGSRGDVAAQSGGKMIWQNECYRLKSCLKCDRLGPLMQQLRSTLKPTLLGCGVVFAALLCASVNLHAASCSAVLSGEWRSIESNISQVLDSHLTQQTFEEMLTRLQWPQNYRQKALDIKNLGIIASPGSEPGFKRLFDGYEAWLRQEVEHHNRANPEVVSFLVEIRKELPRHCNISQQFLFGQATFVVSQFH